MTLQDELTTAAAKGNTADVEALLRRGADVNGKNQFGRTALQVGAMCVKTHRDKFNIITSCALTLTLCEIIEIKTQPKTYFY